MHYFKTLIVMRAVTDDVAQADVAVHFSRSIRGERLQRRQVSMNVGEDGKSHGEAYSGEGATSGRGVPAAASKNSSS